MHMLPNAPAPNLDRQVRQEQHQQRGDNELREDGVENHAAVYAQQENRDQHYNDRELDFGQPGVLGIVLADVVGRAGGRT